MSSLLLILIGTIIGGLIGYVAFWLRAKFSFSSHMSFLWTHLVSFSFAGNLVFRGTLAGLVAGALVAVIAETMPW